MYVKSTVRDARKGLQLQVQDAKNKCTSTRPVQPLSTLARDYRSVSPPLSSRIFSKVCDTLIFLNQLRFLKTTNKF